MLFAVTCDLGHVRRLVIVGAWDEPVHYSQIEQLVEKIFAGGRDDLRRDT